MLFYEMLRNNVLHGAKCEKNPISNSEMVETNVCFYEINEI